MVNNLNIHNNSNSKNQTISLFNRLFKEIHVPNIFRKVTNFAKGCNNCKGFCLTLQNSFTGEEIKFMAFILFKCSNY